MEHPEISRALKTGYPRGGERVGEISEMILDGLICEMCTKVIDGEEPGHPRRCEDCE